MKTRLLHKKKSANTLLTVLVICSILSLSVIGYLSLIEQQHLLSSRSQAWNMAIAIAEAGVEEGLEQLNTNPTNLVADGWTQSGSAYTRSNVLADGNSYTVTIIFTNWYSPVITSRAYFNAAAFAQGRVPAFFAYVGPSPGSEMVSRAVQVRCSKGGLFTAGLVAKHLIDLRGNGILSDSFDSADPAKSTNGRYDDTKYVGDRGDIATNDGMTAPLGVNNANIYGIAHTGPGGIVAVGSQGGVGSHTFQASNLGQIEDDWWRQDSNFTFPSTEAPYNQTDAGVSSPLSGYVALATNITTTTTPTFPAPNTYAGLVRTNYGKKHVITGYTYNLATAQTVYITNYYNSILEAGKQYYVDDLIGPTVVTGPGVTLVVRNAIDLTQPFTIAQGSDIKVYTGGSAVTLNGNQVFNQDGLASSFTLYCSASVTDFTLNGNGQFTGVVVAPNATAHMNGSGKYEQDFVGTLMVDNVILNGSFRFHYDEALALIGTNGRFLITSWDEIP